MSRKDYIRIAAILKDHGATPELVADFADMLYRDNERFDRERFFAACGVEQ